MRAWRSDQSPECSASNWLTGRSGGSAAASSSRKSKDVSASASLPRQRRACLSLHVPTFTPARRASFRSTAGLPWMNSAPSSRGVPSTASRTVSTRPPGRSRASSTATRRPARASRSAAASPEAPAPRTTTSQEQSMPLPWARQGSGARAPHGACPPPDRGPCRTTSDVDARTLDCAEAQARSSGEVARMSP
jgi:hypothetical protein